MSTKLHIFLAVKGSSHLWKNLWRVWKNLCYQQLFCLFAESPVPCMNPCINAPSAAAAASYVAVETDVFSCKRIAKSFGDCQNRQRKQSPIEIRQNFFVENNQKFHRYDLPAAGDTVPKQKNGGTPCPVKWRSAV